MRRSAQCRVREQARSYGGQSRAAELIEHMDTLREFLHMGGYGFYVWSAYGVTFVVLVANVLVPMLRARDLRARLARQARLEPKP